MGLFLFLTVIQAIIAAALVGVVLMQRSEGGGLGVGGGGGGGPGGLMSARGAADFLTRTTKWLAVMFVVLAIVLAAMAVDVTSASEIDQTLDRSVTTPAQTDPLAPALGGDLPGTPSSSAPVEGQAPAPASPPADPLADVSR